MLVLFKRCFEFIKCLFLKRLLIFPSNVNQRVSVASSVPGARQWSIGHVTCAWEGDPRRIRRCTKPSCCATGQDAIGSHLRRGQRSSTDGCESAVTANSADGSCSKLYGSDVRHLHRSTRARLRAAGGIAVEFIRPRSMWSRLLAEFCRPSEGDQMEADVPQSVVSRSRNLLVFSTVATTTETLHLCVLLW